jgi:hypothetical protein
MIPDIFLESCKAAGLALGRIAHLRTRHILTRQGHLRLRYITSGVAGLALVAGLHLGGMIDPNASIPESVVLAQDTENAAVVSALEPAAGLNSDTIFSAAGQVGMTALSSLLNPHRDAAGQIRRDRPPDRDSRRPGGNPPAAAQRHPG